MFACGGAMYSANTRESNVVSFESFLARRTEREADRGSEKVVSIATFGSERRLTDRQIKHRMRMLIHLQAERPRYNSIERIHYRSLGARDAVTDAARATNFHDRSE